MTEDMWFMYYQELLIRLANTDAGRDLLHIDPHRKMPFRVVGIAKNVVKYYLGRWEHRDWFASEFHVGAKWGNIIRSRWQEVCCALNNMNAEIIEASRSPSGLVLAGATTTSFYPDPHTETTTVDGNAGRAANGSWTAIRTGEGDNSNDSQTTLDVTIASAGDPTWTTFSRVLLGFDLTSLGTDSIDSSTFETAASTKREDFDDSITLCESQPVSNTGLINGDYGTLQTTKFATDINVTTLVADSTYDPANVMTLNAAGLAFLGAGVRNFGLIMTNDFDNTEPASTIADDDSAWTALSADTAGTSADPKLIVVHTTSFVPGAIII